MTMVYLSHPGNQMAAHACNGMPVLISYANFNPWMTDYMKSFSSLLLDSGAFSELTGKVKVNVQEYCEWAKEIAGAAAFAGLDDIGGNWKRSLENYKYGGFPTMHEADPPELLADLIPMARERGGWIGVGLTPPRGGKESIVRRIVEHIPDDLHVHGWACRGYASQFDSVDSTNWFRDAWKLQNDLPWLTPGEALDLIVLRYKREELWSVTPSEEFQRSLFGSEES